MVFVDILLRNGQANTRALVGGSGVQPLKNDENPIQELLVEPNAVILHGNPAKVAGRDGSPSIALVSIRSALI